MLKHLTISHALQIIVGAIFVFAGFAKSWDPVLFYWEAIPHAQSLGANWETSSFLAKFAMLLGPIEVLIGTALIVNWLPRIILPSTAFLLTIFSILTAKAWYMGASVDCGCFGTFYDMSPGESLLKNILMFAALIPSLSKFNTLKISRFKNSYHYLMACVFIAYTFLLLIRLDFERISHSDLKEGVNLVSLDGKTYDLELDLTDGDYLIEMFSPTCQYCQMGVPKLHQIMKTPGFPTVVALTNLKSDHPNIVEFKRQFNPEFDIVTISHSDYLRLTFGHGIPRIAEISDGKVVRAWPAGHYPEIPGGYNE